jgi:Ca2+-binding EF-hand superfamily protein
MSMKAIIVAATTLAAAASFALPAAAAAPPAPLPLRGEVMFWLIDRNNDGVIEQSEIEALRTVVFDALDADHNGTLTRDEVTAVLTAARARIADNVANAIKQPAANRGARILKRLGLDTADGISKADFVSNKMRLFARADANSDGRVTREEFEAVRGRGFGGAMTP